MKKVMILLVVGILLIILLTFGRNDYSSYDPVGKIADNNEDTIPGGYYWEDGVLYGDEALEEDLFGNVDFSFDIEMDLPEIERVQEYAPGTSLSSHFSSFDDIEMDFPEIEEVQKYAPISSAIAFDDGSISVLNRFQTLLDYGFLSSIEMDSVVSPCQVTPEIEMYYQGAVLFVKVVNRYDLALPLKDCEVCYIRCDDRSGVFYAGSSDIVGDINMDLLLCCGQTSYNEVKEGISSGIYSSTDDTLVYKSGPSISARFDFSLNPPGSTELINRNHDIQITFSFENDILNNICVENLTAEYIGLNDNIEASRLKGLTEHDIEIYIDLRDDVLEKLIAAIENADIDVSVNRSSGEITMDNAVLFDFDSAMVKNEGEEYLNKLISVYSSILLSEDFADKIEMIMFEGHTDSSGSFDYNLDLSERRAKSVLDYCLQSESLSAEQKKLLQNISRSKGYSYADLVYDDNGCEDADASRRVAIKFFLK